MIMKKNPTKPTNHPKPFPWRCSACGKNQVNPATIRYTATAKHHGRKYTVEVPALPVLQCGACEEYLFTNSSQSEIDRALRSQLGRLQPEEIQKQRLAIGWTQKQLAAYTGAAEATVSRWENGTVIQSKRSDQDLRACFAGLLSKIQLPASTQGDVKANEISEPATLFLQCIRQYVTETHAPTLVSTEPGEFSRKDRLCHELFVLLADLYATEGDGPLENAIRNLKWLQVANVLPTAVLSPNRRASDLKLAADSYRRAMLEALRDYYPTVVTPGSRNSVGACHLSGHAALRYEKAEGIADPILFGKTTKSRELKKYEGIPFTWALRSSVPENRLGNSARVPKRALEGLLRVKASVDRKHEDE
jgi:putative zinc finger/helix-turn-helix YgiT family protein